MLFVLPWNRNLPFHRLPVAVECFGSAASETAAAAAAASERVTIRSGAMLTAALPLNSRPVLVPQSGRI